MFHEKLNECCGGFYTHRQWMINNKFLKCFDVANANFCGANISNKY